MPAERRFRRALAGLCYVAGWLCLVPLAVVAAARLLAWDARSLLVGLNGLTPLLFLPAWVVAFVAAVRRRWSLAAAAGLLVVAHLGFVLPELRAAEPVPAAARVAPRVRIFDANVYAPNTDVAGYAEEIRQAHPDVVVLQESTPQFLAALDATGVLAELPHRVVVSRSDPFAAAVVSRWTIRDNDVVSVRDRPVLIRATIESPAVPLRLFAFHAISPVAGFRHEWVEDLDALGQAVSAEDDRVLVVGDFNATWGHRAFRRLLQRGLADAAAARGRPFQMTWPRNRPLLPPLLRIDHALTTRGVVVTRIVTGSGSGSDHRPLVADVAVT